MKHRLTRYLIGILVFLCVFPPTFICLHLIAEHFGISPPVGPAYRTAFLELFLLAIPLICAISLARDAMRWYSRKNGIVVATLGRRVALVLMIGYILTAIIGVPTVQN